jgi:predicted DsbA family dithiol-disulfide isomerase
MPIAEMFSAVDTKAMMRNLRNMGAPFGITFVEITRISNSRLALQAAEFSRDHERFDAFHDALLNAYFSQGLDIGEIDVLLELGRAARLDSAHLRKALKSGTYLSRLKAMHDEASKAGVTGLPTFIFDGQKTIVGVHPLDVFRKTLQSLR